MEISLGEKQTLMEINLKDGKNFDVIINEIHDYYFDVDQIFYDKKNRFVQIRFEKTGKKLHTSPTNSTLYLRIEEVLSFRFEDISGVGGSSINELKYDANNKEIIFECNIPFLMIAKVEDINLYLSNEFMGPNVPPISEHGARS
jgi:hypothetical protein